LTGEGPQGRSGALWDHPTADGPPEHPTDDVHPRVDGASGQPTVDHLITNREEMLGPEVLGRRQPVEIAEGPVVIRTLFAS
jgi:hypothetical protein